jgi:hypothetical protein
MRAGAHQLVIEPLVEILRASPLWLVDYDKQAFFKFVSGQSF